MALQETALAQEQEMVTFQLGREEFGLNIMSVQEIVRMPDITRIPRAPDYVEGISNLRGNVLPVINTRHRFSMEQAEQTDRTRVVVIDLDQKNVGLVVDSVNEVLRVESEKIEPPPKVVDTGIEARFLDGVVKLNDGKRLVMSLDLRHVCDIEMTEQSGEKVQESNSSKRTEESMKAIDEEQLVSFFLAGEEFALDIQVVKEIIRIPDLVKLPNAPDYVMGLISLRNKLLPMVDLRQLFGQKQRREEADHMINKLMEQKETNSNWMASVRDQLNRDVEDRSKRLDLAVYPLLEWLNVFRTDYELLQMEIDKLKVIAAEINDLRIRCSHVSFSEAELLLRNNLEILNSRMEESFEDAIKAIRENDEQRVIVTETDGKVVGLMVDRVSEVMRISRNLIDPPPKLVGENSRHAEKGVAKLNDGKRLVMILDNNQLFDADVIDDLVDTNDMGDSSGPEENADTTLEQHDLEEEQLVTFKLGNEDFGIRIMQIQEINRLTEITRVPRTPDYVTGVTNLRGVVVPVIDLRKRFAMDPKEADDRTRVVIVDLDGKKTGLIVDQVSEVMRMLKKDIAPPPEVVSTDGVNQYIDGIGKLDEGKRMLVRLDVESILSKTEIKQLARMGQDPETKPAPMKKAKSAARKKLKKADETEALKT